MSFNKYINKIKDNFRTAIKVEWLNPDESVKFEFTNKLYDVNVNLDVNYQNGSRRSCTLILNNERNKFPIDFNNIWIGQKFKLWMGVYLDDETPYYLPQGVFYVSNPSETYNPSTRTVTINGVDKWAYLDGTLNGKLTGTYKTGIGVNLYDATRRLLKFPTVPTHTINITSDNIEEYFEVTNISYYFEGNGNVFTSNNKGVKDSVAKTTLKAKQCIDVSFDYSYSSEFSEAFDYDAFSLVVGGAYVENAVGGSTTYKSYSGSILEGETIIFYYKKDNDSTHKYNDECTFSNMVITTYDVLDPLPPLLSPHFLTKTDSSGNNVIECPYTATVERGQTYADILLEYATILCANIYYDVNGRLVLEPMIDTADDITDTNKEILWDYTVDEKTFLGLTQTYNFDKVYNDFIVLGNITNGYQFKGRVQNRNPLSNTCVQKIGLKTKEPIEDNQYVSDEQCVELAKYHAKTDTILQKSGDISSVVLYHLDVNKLVTISTPNNNMSKELFLITGFSLSTSGTMTLTVVSVNILKDFSVVEAEVYG